MRVVLSTCPAAEAERIAKALVLKGAACVNIVPGVRSVYLWKGQLQDESETMLVIKASAERLPMLEALLGEVHPYDLPEWVVLQPDETHTSEAYRAWVRDPA